MKYLEYVGYRVRAKKQLAILCGVQRLFSFWKDPGQTDCDLLACLRTEEKELWTCGHNMVLSIFFSTTEMSRQEKFLIFCKTQLPYLTYGDTCLAFNNVFQGSDDLKVM